MGCSLLYVVILKQSCHQFEKLSDCYDIYRKSINKLRIRYTQNFRLWYLMDILVISLQKQHIIIKVPGR